MQFEFFILCVCPKTISLGDILTSIFFATSDQDSFNIRFVHAKAFLKVKSTFSNEFLTYLFTH